MTNKHKVYGEDLGALNCTQLESMAMSVDKSKGKDVHAITQATLELPSVKRQRMKTLNWALHYGTSTHIGTPVKTPIKGE